MKIPIHLPNFFELIKRYFFYDPHDLDTYRRFWNLPVRLLSKLMSY